MNLNKGVVYERDLVSCLVVLLGKIFEIDLLIEKCGRSVYKQLLLMFFIYYCVCLSVGESTMIFQNKIEDQGDFCLRSYNFNRLEV